MLASQQHIADLFNRVALVAHLLHLVAGPVLGRIRHRVTAIAIGFDFQNVRAFARAAVGNSTFTGLFDGQGQTCRPLLRP